MLTFKPWEPLYFTVVAMLLLPSLAMLLLLMLIVFMNINTDVIRKSTCSTVSMIISAESFFKVVFFSVICQFFPGRNSVSSQTPLGIGNRLYVSSQTPLGVGNSLSVSSQTTLGVGNQLCVSSQTPLGVGNFFLFSVFISLPRDLNLTVRLSFTNHSS